MRKGLRLVIARRSASVRAYLKSDIECQLGHATEFEGDTDILTSRIFPVGRMRGPFVSKLKLGLWINPGSNFGRGMGEIIVEAKAEGSYERKYTTSGAHRHVRSAPGLLTRTTWGVEDQSG